MDDFDAKSYWNARLDGDLSLGTIGFKTFGQKYNCWLYRMRSIVFDEVVHDLPIKWGDIYVREIGPGGGFYIEKWQQLGVKRLNGIDISNYACEYLGGKFPEYEFLADDATNKDIWADDEYDVISAFDVLFHIVDDEKYIRLLRLISESLKHGGYFLFTESFGRTERRQFHYVSRNKPQMMKILDNIGLQLVRQQPVFAIMNMPENAGRLAKMAWKATFTPLALINGLGDLYGRILFPIERYLIHRPHDGVGTVMYIFRK